MGEVSSGEPEVLDIQIEDPSSRSSKGQWQLDRLLYVKKGLDPAAMDKDPETGKLVPLPELLGQKDKWLGRRILPPTEGGLCSSGS